MTFSPRKEQHTANINSSVYWCQSEITGPSPASSIFQADAYTRSFTLVHTETLAHRIGGFNSGHSCFDEDLIPNWVLCGPSPFTQQMGIKCSIGHTISRRACGETTTTLQSLAVPHVQKGLISPTGNFDCVSHRNLVSLNPQGRKFCFLTGQDGLHNKASRAQSS